MFLEEIKNKKEFRGLSDAFVSRVLLLCSTNYDVTKEKEKKMLVKEARAKLRELYSAYQLPGYSRKENYLKNMEHWGDKAVARRILSLHMSTKERVPYYDPLYAKLRKNVPFKTVLDLGCGLNVFSLPWMGYVAYYGIDVNKDDVDFCNTYLQKFGLQGGVRWGDILSVESFVHTDICFMFKMLESLEALERGSTAKLLERITSPYIIASFATRSLGGGKVISAKRLKWFKELVPHAEQFTLGSEVYFLIKNKV